MRLCNKGGYTGSVNYTLSQLIQQIETENMLMVNNAEAKVLTLTHLLTYASAKISVLHTQFCIWRKQFDIQYICLAATWFCSTACTNTMLLNIYRCNTTKVLVFWHFISHIGEGDSDKVEQFLDSREINVQKNQFLASGFLKLPGWLVNH